MLFHSRVTSSVKDRYYHVWITPVRDQVFFANNIDKAYVISLLQDLLSPRNRKFAPSIDLIAYSLTDFGINLLICTSSATELELFAQQLLTTYADFLNAQRSWEVLPFNTIFAYDNLTDEHDALAISREIHLLHDDWRHDRYSSIGFYIDDRRGDWIQPWRLTDLFGNDALWYQDFMIDELRFETSKEYEYLEI
ncbi:MAG: hypothetical protein ABIP50_01395 [Candidatus Saccharimonadales bacterium]